MTPLISGVRVLTGVFPKMGLRAAFLGVIRSSSLSSLNDTFSGVAPRGVLGTRGILGVPLSVTVNVNNLYRDNFSGFYIKEEREWHNQAPILFFKLISLLPNRLYFQGKFFMTSIKSTFAPLKMNLP